MLVSVQQKLVVVQLNNTDLQHSLAETMSLESRELHYEQFVRAGSTFFWIINPR